MGKTLATLPFYSAVVSTLLTNHAYFAPSSLRLLATLGFRSLMPFPTLAFTSSPPLTSMSASMSVLSNPSCLRLLATLELRPLGFYLADLSPHDHHDGLQVLALRIDRVAQRLQVGRNHLFLRRAQLHRCEKRTTELRDWKISRSISWQPVLLQGEQKYVSAAG